VESESLLTVAKDLLQFLLLSFCFSKCTPFFCIIFLYFGKKELPKYSSFFFFFCHDTHQISPEKREKVKQVFMLYKAHKDCGQAQDVLLKRWKLVLSGLQCFFIEFLFVAIIGSSIGRCREKVMTSLGRFSQIWLLNRATTDKTSISKPNIIFCDYYNVFPSLLGIENLQNDFISKF
jgi:hypothetical protein